MSSYVVKYTAAENEIRAIAIDGTEMVNEAYRRHQLSPVATAALGRAMMGAQMLAANFKTDSNHLTMRILGDGPLGAIVVTATGGLEARGYVQEPHLQLPLSTLSKLDVGAAVGKNGQIHITKDLQLKEPYTGTSDLVSGEIGEDLASYLFYSEQTPSIVALGVLIDEDNSVLSAGGYIIQLLPGAKDETISRLETRAKELQPITTEMQSGSSIESIILDKVLQGFSPVELEKKAASFKCQCNREKLETTLISLGDKEITDIINQQGQAELICHFCNEQYHFKQTDLKRLLNEMK